MKFFKTLLLLPVLVAGFAAPSMAQDVNIAVFNEERVLRESAVGQHIATRMQAIGQEIQAEMQAMNAPIQQETDRLNAEVSSMTPQAVQERPDLMQRIQTLSQQTQQLEVERRVRQQEVAATQRQAMAPVYQILQPILEEVVEQRGIDILVDRSNLVFASERVDITDSVIEILNQRLPSVTVTRVRVPRGDEAAAAQQQ